MELYLYYSIRTGTTLPSTFTRHLKLDPQLDYVYDKIIRRTLTIVSTELLVMEVYTVLHRTKIFFWPIIDVYPSSSL
jgi:hypothetical protein